ncbi:MAG TPA: hypothetical protein VFS79_11565 [Arthrobacter sp.]|nr:hypothetical protein [Arthrobacter sp.]
MAEATPSGSGGPIRVSGPADDGPLAIRGGVGGIRFQLEELAGGAEKLDDLAGRLAAIEVEVRRIWEDLTPFQDLPRWTGTMALNAVGEAGRSVQVVRTELQHISRQVRACKHEYEMAERLAGAARGLGLVSLEDIHDSMTDMAATRFLDGKSMETIVARLGLQAADVKRRTEREPWARDVLEQVGVFSRPLAVHREETVRVDLDTSPAGLLDRIRKLSARGAGLIEVVEISNDGTNAYVLLVPGTQPAFSGVGGENPFDEAGIAEAMVYSSDEVTLAALQSLQAAGAQPGSPVVAVGYSQGGIHAMNLAADPRFLNNYDLPYVLTAGSPVAGITPEPGVKSLHLEHRADWVPGSDGAPNPDTRDRVTVSMTNTPRVLEGEGGIGPAHSLSTYQDGARLVSQSRDPSLAESTAALGAILGAGGAATATRFSLSRIKAPAPAAASADSHKPARGYAGR